MLDPDYLDKAGERVASVYSQIEADMLDYLVGKMIDGDIAGQRSQTAINLLAQNSAGPLMEIVGKREHEISAAVRLEVTEALRRSDSDDLARIKRGLGVDLPSITTRQIAATVAGAEAILSRQNLLMAESARNAFLQQSIWAVTQVNTGAMTTEKALHAAVRRLEREGISLITYRNSTTGLQTVQNKVDVAVRRHIRTQIAQDGMRLTEERMDAAGVDLVEVSSHGGARPSHAQWEGRVYSRNGDKTVGGVRYRDFKTACNWGDVADGIGGANCRHSYAAWFPGMARTYRPNPDHPSGKTNAEVYELTQRQRAGERAIRQTKRELGGAEKLYEATKSAESLGEVSRLKIRLRDQQEAVRKLVSDNPKVLQRSPRREWAGDMPKVKVPKASGRKVDDFLGGEAVGKTLKAKGASKKAAKEALAEAMKERGGTLKDFSALTASEQQLMFRRSTGKLGKDVSAKQIVSYKAVDGKSIKLLQDKSDDAYRSFNNNERKFVDDYTTGLHDSINPYLYGKSELPQGVRDKYDEIVGHIDSAIRKFDLQDDIIVYSGTNSAHYSDWAVGDVNTIGGYLSTAVTSEQAEWFVKSTKKKGKVPLMIEIRVPSGTPGMYIGNNTAFHRAEDEFLLSHGLSYKVVEKDADRMVLEVVGK